MRVPRAFALAAMLALVPALAGAQDFPSRPIHVLVSTSAGGVTDVAARIVGEHIAAQTGQSVVIEDRPGASGNLAMEDVARAAPDGYTLGFANTGNIVINPLLYRQMSFDPRRDLVPVAPVGTVPLFLVTNTFIPPQTLKDFIAYVKANPDKVSYAAAGAGTTPDLTAREFARRAGLSLVFVPFHGTGPAVAALLGNDVQFTFVSLGPHIQLLRQGKLRVLAAATARRAAYLPDVPTFGEQGFAGLEATTWFALFAPRGTPQPVVARLNGLVRDALADAPARQKIEANYIEPLSLSLEEFADLVHADADKWGRIVHDVGATLE